MRKSASLPCFLVARLVKFTFIATISLSDFDFKLYKLSLSENICFVDFFQEILIELSTVDVSFGTSCKHATSPITRFSNVSFDWSVEKCHCQINVVGRYVLISKMNFYLFPRCSDATVMQQLCKPSTSSRVCITVSNSPNPSRVYIRLCKHGKRFLLLKWCHV